MSKDREAWPPKNSVTFTHRGLRCALRIMRHKAGPVRMGWPCGYVRLPLGHPWEASPQEADADVFGGVTFDCVDLDGHTWIGWDGMHVWDPGEGVTPESETRRLADQVADACRRIELPIRGALPEGSKP